MKTDDYTKLIDWQRNVMGNHCTICWNRNAHSQCIACGWWGYVRPGNGYQGPTEGIPSTIDCGTVAPVENPCAKRPTVGPCLKMAGHCYWRGKRML